MNKILITIVGIGTALYLIGGNEESNTKPEVKPKQNTTIFTCEDEFGQKEFTVDGSRITKLVIKEPGFSIRTIQNPEKNWKFDGIDTFEHNLFKDPKQCEKGTKEFKQPEIDGKFVLDKGFESQDYPNYFMFPAENKTIWADKDGNLIDFKFASQTSLLEYVKREVNNRAGANEVKFHTVLGINYKIFHRSYKNPETETGRSRLSLHVTVTNVFGAKQKYTATVLAQGSEVLEFNLYEGHR